MTWAKIALSVVQLFVSLIALFRSQRDREAGRDEAIAAGTKAAEAEEAQADQAAAQVSTADPMAPDEFMRKD